jgi:hypothetical protein
MRGAVNGMVPDLRFVLGASLAIAMLAVAGFGLAISSQLLHQARVNPVESTQSLAYAGRAEDNPFYDPSSALRFTKAKADDPAVPLLMAKPPNPIPTPPATPEEPITTPANRIEANVAGDKAADPPPAIEPAAAETLMPSEGTKPPEGSAGAAASPAVETERVANAPAVSPAADIRKDEDPPSPAENAAESAPPAPATKPVHHRPRPKVARAPRPGEQGFQYSGFPTGYTQQWSSYGSPWGTAPGAKRKNGAVAR